MNPIVLPVRGASPYDVVIGRGLTDQVAQVLGEKPQKVAVVHDEALGELVRPVIERLESSYDVLPLALPSGESCKTAGVVADAWAALGEAGFTRSDAVVAFGGGATTDVGGFIAATWLRGVRVVQVPTTLLGMVDAAVGGKTGINTEAGKNLVGSFHEPAGVIVDLDMLHTLARQDLIAGMGEVIKCGFIADPEILRLVEESPEAATDTAGDVLPELVRRAIQVKIDVVVADLKETGGVDGHPGREALNYGHTLAHAIERAEGYTMRHGEAVSIGCVFVAELARRAGHLDDETAARHARTFGSVGLPTSYAGASFEELLATMRIDKKSRGNLLRFVVLDEIGTPVVLEGPAEDDLRAAYEMIAR